MTDSSGRLLGRVRADGDRWVLRMEDRFEAAIGDVWAALSEPPRLQKWIGEVDGDLCPGGMYRRRFFASGSEGTGRIEACEAPRRLVVRHFAERADEHLIDISLAVDGDGTRFVAETFELPSEKLFAYGAGIQIHVEDLGDYLAGREVANDESRWDALLPRYKELTARSGIPS